EAEDLELIPALEAAGINPLPIWLTFRDREPQEPFLWAEDSARGNVEHGLYHPRLQEVLLDLASQRGVTIWRPAALESLQVFDDHVELQVGRDGESRVVRARIAVGADGPRSMVRTSIGIEQRKDPVHHRFAGLLIEDASLDQSTALAGLMDGGRFFILPQGDGRARLYAALLPDRMEPVTRDRTGKTLIAAVARYLPEGTLAGATVAGPQGVFSAADTWIDSGSSGRVTLVGDAAGTSDPSLGHGMALSLRDARELAGAIRKDGLGPEALASFGKRRQGYLETLRMYGRWMAELWLEAGPEADARRARYMAARASDPDIAGFAQMTSRGPRDLVATDEIRSRFFGETVIDSEAD
ncbi:MAG: FAD-dependent monooxygenase, partial [Chloroflexota bacterium]|nr:FAD-dependent monooxygenase [Chloroflexota bacterium]